MTKQMSVRLPSLLLLATSVLAAQTTPTDQPVYTLQQTVQAVVLDVVVTDRDGHPWPGLTAKDFTVTEDKVPQRIDLFEAPAEHVLPPTAAGKHGDALVRASGASPLTLLLIDEISTSPEDLYYARHQTADFLAKQPATLPNPTTLLALTSKNLRTLADYTTSRDQLLAAIKADKEPPAYYMLRDRQAGYETTGLTTSFDRLRTDLSALVELARTTESHPARKNLIWVGPGLPALNSLQAMDRTARDTIREAILRCSTALLHSRLTLSTVDPKGLVVGTTELVVPSAAGTIITNGGDPALDELSFEQLALQTGGQVRRMRNDVDAEIQQVAASGAQYYTLSYYPTNKAYNGKYRQIRITLADPNLRAHYREGYDALPSVPPSNTQAASELAFALTSSLHYQSVGLSARFAPSNPNTSVASAASEPAGPVLHAMVDIADLHFEPDPSTANRLYSNVTFVVAAMSREGKVLSYHVDNMHATMPAGSSTPLPNSGLKAEFLLHPTVPAKTATLRLLVRDPVTAHLGSTDLPINVPGLASQAPASHNP